MLHTTRQSQRGITCLLLFLICFALTLTSFMFSGKASARTSSISTSLIQIKVDAGFDSLYRDGSWIPVHITLQNNGPDFNGTVSIDEPANAPGVTLVPPSTYQEAVSLPSGTTKALTLYMPLFIGVQIPSTTLVVKLQDTKTNTVQTANTTVNSLQPNDILVGILSDQPSTSIRALQSITFSNTKASIKQETLNATSFPDLPEVLNNFDILIMDQFTTSTLNKSQLLAMESWVNRGGDLLLVGGPEWRRTFSGLPEQLSPVTLAGLDTLPAHTSLLPVGGPTKGGPGNSKTPDSISTSLTISAGYPRPGSTTILSSDASPLIVQAAHGQGLVCYLAFDPALEPIASWTGATTLWKGLLFRLLGDQTLAVGPNYALNNSWRTPTFNPTGMNNLLQSFFPTSFPHTWILLVLLLCYVAVLGPVRFALVHFLKNRSWSWRVTLITILIFSTISYGLALQQKDKSIISSSISLIQLGHSNSSGSIAQITTYVGVLIPNQDNFAVHIPRDSLVQMATDTSNNRNNADITNTIIQTNQNGIDVNLLTPDDSSTTQTLVSTRDRPLSGGIQSHLQLQNNALVGTVTNTLPYTLNDAYVLFNNTYTHLGGLTSKQTLHVHASLGDQQTNTQNGSLADQIAESKGMNTAGTTGGTIPQNELQRRIDTLMALSGENNSSNCLPGSCIQPLYTRLIAANRGLYGSNLPYQLSGSDPLQLPGAPATLLAWADVQPDTMGNITINNNASTGTQEALLQAPLDVSYAGLISANTNVTMGQLVDAQSLNNTSVQLQLPGIYSLASGSMTFEFTTPNTGNFQINKLLIKEPDNLTQLINSIGNGPAIPVDSSRIHGFLYNWQNNKWDAITFNQYQLQVNQSQAYVDPGGRVLLQFINEDPTQGTIWLGIPSLRAQGMAG